MEGCTECGRVNRAARRFCADCGAALSWSCGSCGFDNEADEKFCGGCGASSDARISARSELRHVAVLFADLEDYTRLSSRLPPEDVHELLGKLFEVVDNAVTDHGGSIDKHIGDNVMALFGAPVAYGNDAERAVRAAVAIHDGVRALGEAVSLPLRMHIGIAAGQVMASGLGSSHHQEYTVIGSSVNLAARLQGTAGGGETLVDDAVHRAVARVVEAEDAGDLFLKGIDEAIHAWKIVSTRAAPTAPHRPIVGRKRELALIAELLERCRDGSGSVAHIVGEAGIGKSRLADEAVRLASAAGFANHRTSFVDFGAAHAVADFMRTLVDSDWMDRIRTSDALLHAYLCDLLGEPIPHAISELYQALDNSAREAGRAEAVTRAVTRAAADSPLVLVVEDLQWASSIGRQLTTMLAATTQRARIVLLTTQRPTELGQGGFLEKLEPAATIELAPLSADESLALVTMLGADDALARAAIERASGNPLFLEEIVMSAEEGGNRDALPSNVHALVQARLDGLRDTDRLAVQVASVLGARSDLSALSVLMGVDSYEPTELLKRQLLSVDGQVLRFRHTLIREGVYASLTRQRRRELHTRAAELLADQPIAHAEHLGRAGDESAAAAFLDAAEGEAAAFRFDSALRLVERASELAPPLVRCRAAMTRGELARKTGDARAAAAAFATAAELATSERERCRAAIGEAAAHRVLSDWRAAQSALDRAQRHQPADAEQGQIHYQRASVLFALSRLDETTHEANLALELAEKLADRELEARALSALGDAAWAKTDMSKARDAFERCVELCVAHGFTQFAIPNRVMLGHVLIWQGEHERGMRETERAIADASSIHHRFALMFALQSLSMGHFMNDEVDGAQEAASRALELARELGSKRFEVELLTQMAEFAITRGQDGLVFAREAAKMAAREGVEGYVGPWTMGVLAWATDDEDERRNAIERGEELIAAGTLGINRLIYCEYAAYAEHNAGNAARAAELLERMEGHIEAGDAVVFRRRAARLRAALKLPAGA